jgi:hypothetical protein
VVANRPHQTLYRQHDLPHRGTFSNDRLKFKRMFETVTRRKQGIFVISLARLESRTFIYAVVAALWQVSLGV